MPDGNTDFDLTDLDLAPDKIADKSRPDSARDPKELQQQFTNLANENFELKKQLAALERQVQTSTILDSLITPYASRTYWFMVAYCGFVGAMLFISSLKGTDVNISDDVLKILVGSTAITVIGLVGMVLTGIFVNARKK